jgi:hypothetical protein
MKAITCQDEAVPGADVIISWKPDFSPQVMTAVTTSPQPLTEPELTQLSSTFCLGLFSCVYLSPPAPVLPLFKPKAHVYTLKMSQVHTLPVPIMCHINKSPFSSL